MNISKNKLETVRDKFVYVSCLLNVVRDSCEHNNFIDQEVTIKFIIEKQYEAMELLEIYMKNN